MSFGRLVGLHWSLALSMTIKDIDKNKKIAEFLNSAPRFKVVILSNDSFDVALPHVNVGKVVATYLKGNNLSEIAINSVKDYLSNAISEATISDTDYGKYVCLTNLGILFEKQLDFTPTEFLANISKNTALFLHWQGDIANKKLYLLNEGSRYFIDLENINHITI